MLPALMNYSIVAILIIPSKVFKKSRTKPLVVVQTSGTTSVPKPINYTHDFAASCIQ